MSVGKTLIVATMFGLSAMAAVPAFADDTTTTTTTTTNQRPAEPGVVVGVPGVVGVEVGKRPAEGCVQHKTTTTDEDSGTSTTTKQTNC